MIRVIALFFSFTCYIAHSENMLFRVHGGYRNINLNIESFKIDSPFTAGLGLNYFLKENIAINVSLGTILGTMSYKDQFYEIKSKSSGRIMFTLGTSLQYYLTKNNIVNSYLGIGFTNKIYKVFYSKFNHNKDILNINNNGGLLLQAGVDINIKKYGFLNFEFRYLFPTKHFIALKEIDTKLSTKIMTNEFLIGLSVPI